MESPSACCSAEPPKRLRLTSKTVFRRPIFAPWYRPIWCSLPSKSQISVEASWLRNNTHHRLISKTSVDAKLNRALFLSKSWSSPRSLPSVPSTSMTIVDEYLEGHIQIPGSGIPRAVSRMWNAVNIGVTHPWSSVVSSTHPSHRMMYRIGGSKGYLQLLRQYRHVVCGYTFAYSSRYFDCRRLLRRRMQIPCPTDPIWSGTWSIPCYYRRSSHAISLTLLDLKIA